MARQDKIEFGTCKICGGYKILTEEHIPPKSAFNNGTMLIYSGEEAMKTITDDSRLPWDFEGLKYKLKQGGRSFKTLCNRCNSYCGTNYVDYYQIIVKSFAYFLSTLDLSKIKHIEAKTRNFKPLPFFKQIIAMFASLTDISNDEKIRNFILDKNNNDFDNRKYRVYMSIFKSGIKRMSGWSFLIRNDGNFKVAEIISYPFIFVLLGNADEQPPENTEHFGADITSFVDFKYEDETSLEVSLPIHECNINLPCDYRTQEEIIKCREKMQKGHK